MQGTGGIRKLRIRISGSNKGKSGGARVIYYHYSDEAPIFLLTVFAKGERVNVNRAQRNDLSKVANDRP